ncbi:adenosine receptor A2a-like [Oculina patagonica]
MEKTANFTGGGNKTETFLQLLCSARFLGEIGSELISFIVVNIFLSITASLGNALILAALPKESSLLPPSKLLFSCLATTDLCVGLIAQPLTVTYLMFLVYEKWNLCRYALDAVFIASYALSGVSLLTVTAISVDRLLALLLEMRYRHVVTLKRTYWVVATFWVVCTVAATLHLIFPVPVFWMVNIGISVCVMISIASYSKIFVALRRHQAQVRGHFKQRQPSKKIPLNIARYRKAVSSALWVQLTLVVCYLPYGIMSPCFSQFRQTSSDFLVWKLTTTLVYLNSSLNPFLYCWKSSEVKQAVKQTIRGALCCLSS